jgi:hypothetical protein
MAHTGSDLPGTSGYCSAVDGEVGGPRTTALDGYLLLSGREVQDVSHQPGERFG